MSHIKNQKLEYKITRKQLKHLAKGRDFRKLFPEVFPLRLESGYYLLYWDDDNGGDIDFVLFDEQRGYLKELLWLRNYKINFPRSAGIKTSNYFLQDKRMTFVKATDSEVEHHLLAYTRTIVKKVKLPSAY